jgi:hypothetical protein
VRRWQKIADAPARRGLLRLQFHDAETCQAGREPLTDEQALAIIAFVFQPNWHVYEKVLQAARVEASAS